MSQEILDKSNQTCTTSKEAVVIRFLRIIEKKKKTSYLVDNCFIYFLQCEALQLRGSKKKNKKIKANPNYKRVNSSKKEQEKKNVNKCSN